MQVVIRLNLLSPSSKLYLLLGEPAPLPRMVRPLKGRQGSKPQGASADKAGANGQIESDRGQPDDQQKAAQREF
jgi:hypothetical protein